MTDEPDDVDDEMTAIAHEADPEEFAMPFVVTSDNGGPFDVDAYTAGWEMGILAARLSAAVFHQLGLPHVTIMVDNVPQVDLLAMAHGCRAYVVPWDESVAEEIVEGWAHIGFEWLTPTPDGVVAPE